MTITVPAGITGRKAKKFKANLGMMNRAQEQGFLTFTLHNKFIHTTSGGKPVKYDLVEEKCYVNGSNKPVGISPKNFLSKRRWGKL